MVVDATLLPVLVQLADSASDRYLENRFSPFKEQVHLCLVISAEC